MELLQLFSQFCRVTHVPRPNTPQAAFLLYTAYLALLYKVGGTKYFASIRANDDRFLQNFKIGSFPSSEQLQLPTSTGQTGLLSQARHLCETHIKASLQRFSKYFGNRSSVLSASLSNSHCITRTPGELLTLKGAGYAASLDVSTLNLIAQGNSVF